MCAGCSYCCDFTALLYTEGILETELPSEARNTRGMYWWGMQGSDTVQVSFKEPPEDLAEFIEQSCIEPLEADFNPLDNPANRNPGIFFPEAERKGLLAFMFGRWEPLEVRQFAGSKGYCRDDYRYSMVVDQSNPGLYTVYLQMSLGDK